jgi:hypothetical protein
MTKPDEKPAAREFATPDHTTSSEYKELYDAYDALKTRADSLEKKLVNIFTEDDFISVNQTIHPLSQMMPSPKEMAEYVNRLLVTRIRGAEGGE